MADTPMMRQYYSVKEQYPGVLVFFRLGDFYEMFADDAITASKILEITLTSRERGYGQKMPMCGVPYHAVDGYIAKLVANGQKVAICEQMEDPKLAKGIVKREVIRVITPGTLVDTQMLPDAGNNYLLAVCRDKNGLGLAYTDISTGEFMVTEILGADLWERLADEVARIHPAECILPPSLYDEEIFHLRFLGNTIGSLSKADNEKFTRENGEALLLTHFKVASLESLGLTNMKLAVWAAGMILDFLQETQKRSLDYLQKVKTYSPDAFMLLDCNTRKNLELTATIRQGQKKGSLLWVCDQTHTPMGGRLLKEWLDKPLLDSEVINWRLDGVEELYQNPFACQELQEQLKKIYDLERLISRIAYGNATPRDLVALKNSLLMLPGILKILAKLHSPIYQNMFESFDLLDDIYSLIEQSMIDDPPLSPKDGGFIRQGYHQEVDQLKNISTQGKSWLANMELKEKEATGIKSLKISYNKVFGYYIEVTNANLSLVPPTYIRKQTLANAERFITEELKEWESKILGAGERLAALEYELFTAIRKTIADNAVRIQATANVIAHLDVLQSLADTASANGYVRPIVNNGSVIKITEGRHPVVEQIIGRENYVPNDVYLDNSSQQLLMITGPNMAGKSTYMRQVALITLLARIGSFVPAQEAVIGKVDRIFTRVGASDDLASGQSTFMVEMCETSNILRHATADSLVIMDEIGRGTSTFDGMSIAWAVAEYLLQEEIGAKTLFATHYHELIQLENNYPKAKNYCVAVQEKNNTITFLRKIVPGGADKSYGIQVASLAGIPASVLNRAKEILYQLESEKKVTDISGELSLFSDFTPEPVKSPVLEEIAALSINDLTPMEALMKINQWQKDIAHNK